MRGRQFYIEQPQDGVHQIPPHSGNVYGRNHFSEIKVM